MLIFIHHFNSQPFIVHIMTSWNSLYPMLIFLTSCNTMAVVRIYSAEYPSITYSHMISYEQNCYECLCLAYSLNQSVHHDGFNCYRRNRTCSFFHSIIMSSSLIVNTDSTVYYFANLTESDTGN